VFLIFRFILITVLIFLQNTLYSTLAALTFPWRECFRKLVAVVFSGRVTVGLASRACWEDKKYIFFKSVIHVGTCVVNWGSDAFPRAWRLSVRKIRSSSSSSGYARLIAQRVCTQKKKHLHARILYIFFFLTSGEEEEVRPRRVYARCI